MAKVECEIYKDRVENDNGIEVDCIKAVCTECGHETMSYGTSERSVKRCLALMGEECPEGESNYYVAEEDWDGG